MLAGEVGKFLRTHRRGWTVLMDWLVAQPPDRTEEEFQREAEAAQTAHEAGVQQQLDRINTERAADGLPPVDRKGNILTRDAGGRKPS
jgi:hypothetical protein